jgi:hypothetical protein
MPLHLGACFVCLKTFLNLGLDFYIYVDFQRQFHALFDADAVFLTQSFTALSTTST